MGPPQDSRRVLHALVTAMAGRYGSSRVRRRPHALGNVALASTALRVQPHRHRMAVQVAVTVPAGSSAPSSCPSGSYGCCGRASSYSMCTAGSYCPDTCNIYTCPSGSYCPADSSAPSSCPSGSYGCCGGASSYSMCTAGSYCPDTCNVYSCPAGRSVMSICRGRSLAYPSFNCSVQLLYR